MYHKQHLNNIATIIQNYEQVIYDLEHYVPLDEALCKFRNYGGMCLACKDDPTSRKITRLCSECIINDCTTVTHVELKIAIRGYCLYNKGNRTELHRLFKNRLKWIIKKIESKGYEIK